MNPIWIILPSVVGFVINTLAVLGFAWRGGRLLGHIDGTLERFASELANLRDHPQILARVVAQLEALEHRVSSLETQRSRR